MLIADDFVFLHIPKTGGTFVQRVISEHLPDVDIGLYTHTCYDDFPEDARHLPGFYVIRNPWDWYVSWVHYSTEWGARRKPSREISSPRKRVVWEDLLRRGQADFREAVTRACHADYDVGAAFPTLDDHG